MRSRSSRSCVSRASHVAPLVRATMANGTKTADRCRWHGISSATFYAWKAEYGGKEPSDAKRLRGLEEENAKPKRLYADARLDKPALRDLLGRQW
ncbi:MAG: transposase [Pseudomonadota bacterium]